MVICKNDGRMIKIMHLICEAIPLANNPRQMRMHDRVSMNHNFMESGESWIMADNWGLPPRLRFDCSRFSDSKV